MHAKNITGYSYINNIQVKNYVAGNYKKLSYSY